MTKHLLLGLAALAIAAIAPAWGIDIAERGSQTYFSGFTEPTSGEKDGYAPWKLSFWLDENGDGEFTFTELKSWFADAFYFPGSFFVWLIWGTGFGIFFEITPISFRSGATGVLSFICWAVCWLSVQAQLMEN